MPATKLDSRYLEKPWGRTDLPERFPHAGGRRIGEIWFEGPRALAAPLLVKYLFTSEPLSIQVHPNDLQAQARGAERGKSECWYILSAEPEARLGIGLKASISAEALRAACMDGSIVTLIDWRPVVPGDFLYVPAGTLHAIGSGLTLVEIQQPSDITYRLFDYGRPRELHIADAVAVSNAIPYTSPIRNVPPGTSATLLQPDVAPFGLRLVSLRAGCVYQISGDRQLFIPIEGMGVIDGVPWAAGECWHSHRDSEFVTHVDSTALIASSAAFVPATGADTLGE